MNTLEKVNLDSVYFEVTTNINDSIARVLQLNTAVISQINTNPFDSGRVNCRNTSVETGTGFNCEPAPCRQPRHPMPLPCPCYCSNGSVIGTGRTCG